MPARPFLPCRPVQRHMPFRCSLALARSQGGVSAADQRSLAVGWGPCGRATTICVCTWPDLYSERRCNFIKPARGQSLRPRSWERHAHPSKKVWEVMKGRPIAVAGSMASHSKSNHCLHGSANLDSVDGDRPRLNYLSVWQEDLFAPGAAHTTTLRSTGL